MNDPIYTMTINGKAVSGAETFGVENPATGQVFVRAPDCSKAQLDAAVDAARAALPAWKATPIAKRRELLNVMAGVIMQNISELSRLLTREQGKPHSDAEGDVGGGAFWLMESSKHEIPEHVSEDSAERHAVTRYGPIGVVAAIVPWNFPVILAAFKLGPALLAGNTIVLKPAPTTPLTTLRIEFSEPVQPLTVGPLADGSAPGLSSAIKIQFGPSASGMFRIASRLARGLVFSPPWRAATSTSW